MEFLNYVGNVFEPIHFSILLAGTAFGLIMGALPGLSPTMAVALLIPFTFHMTPIAGLILLGSVYTATVAGGAVSAILLKIPGAPANIATALDGYRMAQDGRATAALQLSFLASGVGGILGVLVLIFFTPILAQWVLVFGPSHLFWIAILGVSVVASLASGSIIKGLISGCLGLWISSIGYDGVHGIDRFTFTSHLEGGIHIIPALVGLFAIPQMINMLARGGGGAPLPRLQPHSLWRAVRKVTGSIRVLSIGSIVGIIIGLIPGAGGQIAGLVAYDQSRKFSPTRETYGSGEPEGLIAAESANNAMVGPSLVPLLTLSVPGSPTAAVLLGGLLIHGIFPGPNLFADYPEVSWTFINSLFFGQILMVILGLMLCRFAARVILLPENYLAAIVVVLAVFGTYSVQHSYSDVLIMGTLGAAMWLLEKYGFSTGPLVLGIVLGPIAEQNFTYGYTIANAGDGAVPYFFGGTLNIALIAIIIASVLSSAVLEFRSRRLQHQHSGDEGIRSESAMRRTGAWRLPPLGTIAGDIALLLFAILITYASFTGSEPEAYRFPQLSSALLLIFAGVNVIRLIHPSNETSVGANPITRPLLAAIAPALIIIALYFSLVTIIGFYATSAVAFFALALMYDGNRNWRLTAVVTLIAISVIYALFALLLQVHTPAALLL